MRKYDIEEAAPIVQRALTVLLGTVSQRGRAGSDVRTAVNVLLVHLTSLLQSDTIGPPLDECFDLARKAGTTLAQLSNNVRATVMAETPTTLGGNLIKNALLSFCFAHSSRIIADMTFTSRDDVELVRMQMKAEYDQAEETVADSHDPATYMALVGMHAATSNFLTVTAQPLPRVLEFRFAMAMPTLLIAQKLYSDAGRADELRAENKVVHPAFMRPEGQAMSS